MKFEKCMYCVKRLRNSDFDRNICMYCNGSNYYESYNTYKEMVAPLAPPAVIKAMFKNNSYIKMHDFRRPMPEIKNVIFNPPATIVFWADNTKTVVKCQEGDTYDPEKGLAMAISKKVLGNKHEYYNTFKYWMKKCPYVESNYPDINIDFKIDNPFGELAANLRKLGRKIAEEEGK